MKNKFTIYTCLFLLFSFHASAQIWTIKFEIVNQPDIPVVLGWVKGDDFTAIDSLKTNAGKIQFVFSEKTHPGVYRIILGQTPYARLMKEDPQKLDFIFNKENIYIKTDFKNPFDKAEVIQSDENKLWFEVLRAKNEYVQNRKILEKEVDYFWEKKDTSIAFEKSNSYNRLQMAHDIYLGQKSQQNANLLAAKIISTYREPLTDGYLTAKERKKIFQQDFFKTLDFSHPVLLYSTAYTDKVFEYVISFNDPKFTPSEREKAYLPAIDEVMKNTKKNTEVYNYIKGYLIHGFEVLKMQSVVDYIKKSY